LVIVVSLVNYSTLSIALFTQELWVGDHALKAGAGWHCGSKLALWVIASVRQKKGYGAWRNMAGAATVT
jgi:hypothetical protein